MAVQAPADDTMKRLNDTINRINKRKAANAVQKENEDPRLAAKFRPLTVEELDLIDETFAKHDRAVVAQKYNQDIKVSDIKCLKPGIWLNDEVMNFYMGLLQDRCNMNRESADFPQDNKINALFMNTCFFHKLHNDGNYKYKNVKRWTKTSKVRQKTGFKHVFELEKMMFPVHVGRLHWCVGVINFRRKRIEYYDSLGGRN